MPLYDNIFDGPARNYRRVDGRPVTSDKKYETIHATANNASAQDEANYAQVRTDGTSSHYYADNIEVIQSLNTDWCAGHVGSYEGNTFGISWEFTGVNAWSRQQWLDNIAWEKVAAQMANDCRNFSIPPRLLTIEEMRAGNVKGFITHDMARIAWGKTDHTDPGPNFPMDYLLERVSAYLDGDGMPELDEKIIGHIIATDARHRALIMNLPYAEFHIPGESAPRKERNEVHFALKALTEKPAVVVDQAVLEAALRKVLGAVDGATPDN